MYFALRIQTNLTGIDLEAPSSLDCFNSECALKVARIENQSTILSASET